MIWGRVVHAGIDSNCSNSCSAQKIFVWEPVLDKGLSDMCLNLVLGLQNIQMNAGHLHGNWYKKVDVVDGRISTASILAIMTLAKTIRSWLRGNR